MSSLASKQGPRYRHTAGEEEPYETIGVEKLTPIIGAEISGVDLGADPTRPTARWTKSIARSRRTSSSSSATSTSRRSSISPSGGKFGELHIHPGGAARAGEIRR